jgi:Zn-dependent peptidase ImmA (M78 family)
VANAGRGFVIVDGTDPDDERRFSLAHEVAHFILDYLLPRRKANDRFGIQITDVLDGYRPPTAEERFGSILSDVSIGIHTHLMDRDEQGEYASGSVAVAESRADKLALELLAPENDVRAEVKQDRHPGSRRQGSERIAAVLLEHFGLPRRVSLTYARDLSARWHKPHSVRSWLGLTREKGSVEL